MHPVGKSACLPCPESPRQDEFPNEGNVKEIILKNICYLDSPKEYKQWKSASFLLNEGCLLSVKGAENNF